jgi:hypothetical protein
MKKLLLILFITTLIRIAANPLPVAGNTDSGIFLHSQGNLADIFNEKEILAEAVLLAGKDGTAAYIESAALQHIYLIYDSRIWASQADSLPPVCSINDLEQVTVWNSSTNTTLMIDLAGRFPVEYTPFHFILAGYDKIAESEKNGFLAYKYKRIKNTLLKSISGKVTLDFLDGTSCETEFRLPDFFFDGNEFFYDQKKLKRISSP